MNTDYLGILTEGITYPIQSSFIQKESLSVAVDSSEDCVIIYLINPGNIHKVAHNLTHEAVNKPRLSITYGKSLDKAQRREGLHDRLSCKTDALVATKAAATGLDKNNIRYVLHFWLSPLCFGILPTVWEGKKRWLAIRSFTSNYGRGQTCTCQTYQWNKR